MGIRCSGLEIHSSLFWQLSKMPSRQAWLSSVEQLDSSLSLFLVLPCFLKRKFPLLNCWLDSPAPSQLSCTTCVVGHAFLQSDRVSLRALPRVHVAMSGLHRALSGWALKAACSLPLLSHRFSPIYIYIYLHFQCITLVWWWSWWVCFCALVHDLCPYLTWGK